MASEPDTGVSLVNWLLGALLGIVAAVAGALWKTHDQRLNALEEADGDMRREMVEALDRAMEAFARADTVNDTLMVEGVRQEINGLRTLMMTMHEANIQASRREAEQSKSAFDMIMQEMRTIRDQIDKGIRRNTV